MEDEVQAKEVEQDLIDLITMSSDESEGDDDVEGLPSELPDDPDELKQLVVDYQNRVSKRNKTVKKRTEATHRMQEEIEALKSQVDSFKNQSTQASTVEAQKQEHDKAIAEWRDSVSDDPSKAVDFATWQTTQMQDKVVNYIASMQQKFDDQIAELKGATNPTRQKYQAKIDQLKSNPRFAGFDDDQLMVLAETLSEAKPRGPIGGKPVNATVSKEKKLDELRKKAREYMNNGLG